MPGESFELASAKPAYPASPLFLHVEATIKALSFFFFFYCLFYLKNLFIWHADLPGIEPGAPALGMQGLSTEPPGKSHTIKSPDPVFPLLLLPLDWPWCFLMCLEVSWHGPFLGAYEYNNLLKNNQLIIILKLRLYFIGVVQSPQQK